MHPLCLIIYESWKGILPWKAIKNDVLFFTRVTFLIVSHHYQIANPLILPAKESLETLWFFIMKYLFFYSSIQTVFLNDFSFFCDDVGKRRMIITLFFYEKHESFDQYLWVVNCNQSLSIFVAEKRGKWSNKLWLIFSFTVRVFYWENEQKWEAGGVN